MNIQKQKAIEKSEEYSILKSTTWTKYIEQKSQK